MTWYADHLFAESSPLLLDQLLANPALSKGVYWVRSLVDYPWHDLRVKHELPPNGLIVVRPICSPSSQFSEWHENRVISWFDVKGKETIEINIVPNLLKQDNPDYDLEAYPPPAFLKYLKQLSHDYESTLAFYHCSMWGGDTDIEFAWVFKNGNEIAYAGLEFREFPNAIKEYRETGEGIEMKGYVLVETLSHFAVHLPTPFFALHTRGFKWEASKMSAD